MLEQRHTRCVAVTNSLVASTQAALYQQAMQGFRTHRYRLMFGAFYALAMVLVAFAHQPVFEDAERNRAAAIDLSAYVLPDGSLPVLCFGDAGDGDGRTTLSTNCDACRIASAAGLPEPSSPGLKLAASRSFTPDITPQSVPTTNAPIRANGPRAPPAALGILNA